MAKFKRRTWVNRIVEFANRYKMTDMETGEVSTINLNRLPGTVTQAGDAVSAENLNDLEDRIEEALNQYESGMQSYVTSAQKSAGEAAASATSASDAASAAGTAESSANNAAAVAESSAQVAQNEASNAGKSADIAQESAASAVEAAGTAQEAALRAAEYATSDYAVTAQSWAVGGTGARDGEDTDNSMYYARESAAQATASAQSAAQAAASETALAASEANAQASAESASASAQAAKNSQSSATGYATQAKNQAVNAQASATSAASSEANAQTFATNAASSEVNAQAFAASAERSATEAKACAENSEKWAKYSESYAKGGTDTRTGEDADNSRYYSDLSKRYAELAQASATGVSFTIVDSLPPVGEDGVFYLIAHSHDEGDSYDEYVWLKDQQKFERIGTTDVDLTDYVRCSDTATTAQNGAMSAADKAKLDNIDNGATKTVVDDALSDTSGNPVANKAIQVALSAIEENVNTKASETDLAAINASKADKATTLAGYGITDGATQSYVDEKVSSITFDVDQTYDATSTNAISGVAVAQAISEALEEVTNGSY